MGQSAWESDKCGGQSCLLHGTQIHTTGGVAAVRVGHLRQLEQLHGSHSVFPLKVQLGLQLGNFPVQLFNAALNATYFRPVITSVAVAPCTRPWL